LKSDAVNQIELRNFIFMKTLLLSLVLLIFACAPSQQASAPVASSNQISPSTSNLSLADYLKRIPGVQVTQTGNTGEAMVLVRGNNSIGGQREPLFIINGVNVGSGYNNAAPLVDVNDISSVQVLKAGNETAPYGLQGNNGVIIIKTKK
jgi:TonB-dependent SusC/RagA subfamily outer membrane receptor